MQRVLSPGVRILSIGHNTLAGDKLKTLAERMERLMTEIDGLKADLKDVKSEAKSEGYNVRALDRLIAIRRKEGALDKETELLNDLLLYAHATGTQLNLELPTPQEPRLID